MEHLVEGVQVAVVTNAAQSSTQAPAVASHEQPVPAVPESLQGVSSNVEHAALLLSVVYLA